MEPLFENTCVWTKKTLREMYYRVYRKWLIVVGVIAALVLLMLLGLSLWFSIPLREMPWKEGLVLLALVVFFAFLPWIQSAAAYKRYVSLYGSAPENRLRFREGRFENENTQSGGHMEHEYAQIRRVMETKSLLLLKLKAKWIIMLDKDGFTRGDAASLQEFLREKLADRKN